MARRFSLRRLLLAVAWLDLWVVAAVAWRSYLSFAAMALAGASFFSWALARRTGVTGQRGALFVAGGTILMGAAAYFLFMEGRSRSRISNTSQFAIACLRTLVISEEQYKNTDGRGRYTSLGGLNQASPPFIDTVLSSGVRSGYSSVLATDGGKNFTAHARPIPAARGRRGILADPFPAYPVGRRSFFVDSSGVIRFNPSGPATSGSLPIE